MARQITFDGANITTGDYKVSKISDENNDSIQVNIFDLARQRGGFLLDKEYKPKKIGIQGSIHGSSASNLDSNIDDLKELLSRQGKNLDIDYSSGTRRYVATCISFKVNRDFYHLTYAPYDAEFIIPAGVGYDIASTSSTTSNITDLIYISGITTLGSAEPQMMTTITINNVNAITDISLLANGDKITITETFNAGDIIIIDTHNMKVTINGSEVDYTGVFPKFVVGANAFQITSTGTSIDYDLTFEYTKTYL